MTRLCVAMVVGLIVASGVGCQAQDENVRGQAQDENVRGQAQGESARGQAQGGMSPGRAGIEWGLPSGYIPPAEWRVQIPFQIFDNVYFVGNDNVSSYLITTSDGLVLIDTTNGLTVKQTLQHIRQLGFDPMDLKYVFVTESHEIHYGGAAEIKALTGATICLSAADWDFLEQAAVRADQIEYDWTTEVAPPRDHETRDGEVITVGNSKFTLYITPGHTPGTSSFEYVAHDGDRRYRVLTPGGSGLSMSSDWTDEWIKGRERLKAMGPWDVVLGNHPNNTPGHLFNLKIALDKRKNGAPHPFVQGSAVIDKWIDAWLVAGREKAAAPPHGHQRRRGPVILESFGGFFTPR